MEKIVYLNSRPLNLTKDAISVGFSCGEQCVGKRMVVIGFSFATYKTSFSGKVGYRIVSKDNMGEFQVVSSGELENIRDNEERKISFEAECKGKMRVDLWNDGAGTVAIWMTDNKEGLEISRGGNVIGRACHTFYCEPKIDNSIKIEKEDIGNGLKFCGLVRTMNIHGGVRRYFEMGNALVRAGHRYSLFAHTITEKTPWMEFLGDQRKFGSWGNEPFDVAMTGDCDSFQDMIRINAKKRVVLVVAKFYADRYLRLWRTYGKNFKWIGVAADWNLGMEDIEGVCIPGGVNTDFFSPLPEKRLYDGLRKPVVAFYARLGDGRGVERIKALAGKLDGLVDFVGFDAPNYDTLKSSGNIRVVQTASQEALRDVLRHSDIVVSCMRSAGWNNCIAEGSACGCVPVGSVAGTKDLIRDGSIGFMPSYTNFENEAAERIEYLAKNPDLLNRMGMRSAHWVRQYDWDVVAERFLKEVLN